MRVVEITGGSGPAGSLVPSERPDPVAAPGQIRIRVRAAGVNRPDILQRLGFYPAPPGASDILGLEVAGEVDQIGSGVTRWSVGDRVCALLGGGGYAGLAVVDARHALPVTDDMDFIQAAALPETVCTVFANVFESGALKPGETLLVHGGTSGIGVTAIQLGKAFGATVLATAGSAEKVKACLDLGADAAIDYKTEDFAEAVKRITDGKLCDVILDMVGGAYFQRNLRSLRMDGRLVLIAMLGGNTVEKADLLPIMLRRITVTGSTMRPRTTAQKGALAAELRAKAWPLLDAGKCIPPLFKVFPLAGAADAHRLMESSQHIGKIMLKVAD